MESGAAGAGAHGEDVDLLLPLRETHPRLAHVDLGFLTGLVVLRDHDPSEPGHLPSAAPNVGADRPLRELGLVLLPQPGPDPVRRVPLLPRRLLVRLEDGIDRRPPGVQRRLRVGPLPPRRWLGTRQRLPHVPAMAGVLAGQLPDTPAVQGVVPTDPFKQLHLVVHSSSP